MPEVDPQQPPRKSSQPGKRKSCSSQRDDREAKVLLAGGIFGKAFAHHVCLKPGAKTELIRHEPSALQRAPTISTGDLATIPMEHTSLFAMTAQHEHLLAFSSKLSLD